MRDGFDAELRKMLASGDHRRLLDQYKIDVAPEPDKLAHARKAAQNTAPPSRTHLIRHRENMQTAQVKIQTEW